MICKAWTIQRQQYQALIPPNNVFIDFGALQPIRPPNNEIKALLSTRLLHATAFDYTWYDFYVINGEKLLKNKHCPTKNDTFPLGSFFASTNEPYC